LEKDKLGLEIELKNCQQSIENLDIDLEDLNEKLTIK